MIQFTSKREKRIWTYAALVVLAIYSTLGIVRPVSEFFRESGWLTPLFIACMVMIVMSVLIYGLKRKAGMPELVAFLGILGVYLLVIARISIPEERTHLIEYGIVGIFVFEAIKERYRHVDGIILPLLYSILITAIIGLIDEGLQYLIPGRFFDPRDVFFNFFAGSMSIVSSIFIKWIREKFSRS